MPHDHLSEFVAASLAAHAGPLARHWLERAVAATPRPPVPRTADPEARTSTAAPDQPAAAQPAVEAELAERVVLALAEGLRPATSAEDGMLQDARPTAEVMRLGWLAGGAAFGAGLSVHHVGRDADLLLAVVLADVERALAAVPPGPGAAAADGLAVARRLQRAVGRYAQAALSGFVHALLRGLRERYRVLRHDLRNPLGTIRSALSLMEDESVPIETRQSPNIRAMVARNAGSLDRLISRRLDDASAAALLAAPYAVLVRDVALAARREVRGAARLAGCEVLVDVPADAPSRVDGAALELTLTTLLLAALARTSAGDRVRVACVGRADLPPAPNGAADLGGDSAPCSVLCVALEHADGRVSWQEDATAGTPEAGAGAAGGGAPSWDASGLELALALAGDYGGRLGADASVDSAHDTDELVAVLARGQAVYLRLPIVEAGTALDAVTARTSAPVPGSGPGPVTGPVRGTIGLEAAR